MKKTMIGMALMAMVAVNASAQEGRQRLSEEEMAARRTEMVQKQAEKFAKDFNLTDDAKTQFVALYTEYQGALEQARSASRVEGEQPNAEEREGRKNKELTDEEATKMIEEGFARQEAQIAQSTAALAVEKEYYDKFKETLTPQQLVKIFAQRQGQRGGQRGGQGQQGGQGERMGGPQGGPMGGGGFGGGDF